MKTKATEKFRIAIRANLFLVPWLLLIFSVGAIAQVSETKILPSVFYLTDYSDVISKDQESKLEKILYQLEKRAEIEFRVVLVNTTGDKSSSEYSEKIWKDWNLSSKSGKGILYLYVIEKRQWEIRVSKDLTKELPNDLLKTIGQASSDEINNQGYNQGISLAVEKFIDELGKLRGFTYTEFAKIADATLENPPPRPENPVPDPSSNIIKLAFGSAISLITALIGLMVIANLFGSLFFWDKKINGNQIVAIGKAILFFVIYAIPVYYFWENLKFYFSFVRVLGEGVAIFGSCLFPILAIILFILLLFSLRYIGRFWTNSKLTRQQILNKSIIITLCLPLIILLLPKSDVSVINSWADKGIILAESSYWSRTFGLNANTYLVDGFGQIRRLSLQNDSINDLKELSGIETLSSLQNLDIQAASLTETLDVPNLPALEALHLRKTQLNRLNGLEKLTKLKELEVENINLDSITNLEQLSQLQSLSLRHCKINNLSRLGNLKKLTSLGLDETDINDLTPLSGLSNLGQLSIAGTAVKDLRPIAHLPIGILDISNTGITNEEVKVIFKRPILIVNGKTGSLLENLESGIVGLDKKYVEPEFRIFRERVVFGIIGASLLVFLLPLFRTFKTYRTYLLRRIFLKTVWGFVFVLFLLTLANVNIPVYFTFETWNVAGKLINWAIIAAIGWLILRPLVILALETKIVNASVWSVPLRFLGRFLPAIVMLGPISYQFMSNLFAAPKNFINIMVIFIFSVFFVLPWVILLIFAYAAASNWQHKMRNLQNLQLSAGNAIIEVSLRPTFLNFNATKNLQINLPNKEINHTVYTTVPLAMLSRLPIASSEFVGASVIVLRHQDLLNLKNWEFELIKEWTANIYVKTQAPSWFVADWVETAQPPSAEMERNLASLDALQQYMSGTEHRVKIKSTVFPLKGDEKIYQCFTANELISQQELNAMNFGSFIDSAFTPVSVLARNLFGHTHLADRLDLIMRVTEISVAFFCLILIAEYEQEKERFPNTNRKKIDEGLQQAFNNPPTFAGWLGLLRTFTKRPETKLATEIKSILLSSPIAESQDLRVLLEESAGSAAVKNISNLIDKRNDALTLLNFVRNLMVAHGPAFERTSPELYRITAITALDFLTSLPWSMVSVGKQEMSKEILFKGLLPSVSQANVSEQKTSVFVHIKDENGNKIITADKYFFAPEGTNSIAVFIGEKGYFDPITGLRI